MKHTNNATTLRSLFPERLFPNHQQEYLNVFAKSFFYIIFAL